MKKITAFLFLFSTIFFSFQTVFGQENITFSKKTKSGKVRCASTEYETFLRNKNPQRLNTKEFQNWIAPKIQELKSNKNYNKGLQIITIPVVIHIIHDGDAIGRNENISDAQALSQIQVLNQDFRRLMNTRGYNNNAVGADIGIEFCLAQRKPDGTATNGIDRVQKSAAEYSTINAVENMKAQTQWNPNDYLNLWTVHFTDKESSDDTSTYGVLGYAQFPSTSQLSGLKDNQGDAKTDGVVIDYRYFGTSDIVSSLKDRDYDKGRTATHEIGHYLGLLHIWGDGEGSSEDDESDCDATDYCDDTPQSGYEHYDCAEVYDTCPSKAGKDMVENYMDYTNDACMNIFTINQRDRILSVMNNSIRRKTLKTSTACTAPTLSKNEFNYFEGVQLYPNPVQNILNVSISSNEVPDELIIYNSLGQVVEHKNNLGVNIMEINTQLYSKGVYFLKIVKQNTSKTFRFIKE